MDIVSGLSLDSFVMILKVIELSFHEYLFVANILLVPETSLRWVAFECYRRMCVSFGNSGCNLWHEVEANMQSHDM